LDNSWVNHSSGGGGCRSCYEDTFCSQRWYRVAAASGDIYRDDSGGYDELQQWQRQR
jgi:hypothetical protein